MAIETAFPSRVLARTAAGAGRPALSRALAEAHARFAECYPQWAASLFDEFFVERHVGPMLARQWRRGLAADPVAVAQAWAGQFNWRDAHTRQRRVIELAPAAARFVRWVEEGRIG